MFGDLDRKNPVQSAENVEILTVKLSKCFQVIRTLTVELANEKNQNRILEAELERMKKLLSEK